MFIDTGLVLFSAAGLWFSWNGIEGPLASCFLASSSSKAPAVCDLSTCVHSCSPLLQGNAAHDGGHGVGGGEFL